MQDKHSSHENCCLQEPSSHLRKPSSKARGSSFYVRELLVAEESFFTQQSSFAGGIVVCRRHRSKRENCHSMHESCCLQDNRSKRENCCLREPSSFAGGIVPSARIVILCARVASVGDLDYLDLCKAQTLNRNFCRETKDDDEVLRHVST